MAVIQISKIQVRRGAVGDQGMPQLASGEMAWAIDQQRLFIGNGSVAEGAPAVGNTEILTSFSTATINLFDCLYTYTGVNTGTTITTGVDSNHPIERTLQTKIDEIEVSVKDFGAVDSQDITENLRRAIKQLYMNSDNSLPSAKRVLKVPAGYYRVTGTNFLPAYAIIKGDGVGRTIIETVNGKTIFATSATNLAGTSFATNTTNITQAREVTLDSMTLRYATTASVTGSNALLVLDNCISPNLNNVRFSGSYQKSTGKALTNTGVRISGNGTTDVVIENCQFESIVQAITGDDDSKTINIRDNSFSGLYRGIAFGTNVLGVTGSLTGPTTTKLSNNVFKNVEKQAVVASHSSSTAAMTFQSFENYFENVGSDNTNDQTQSTAVLSLFGTRNRSALDRFNRYSLAQTTYANKTFKPLIEGPALVDIEVKVVRDLVASASTQTMVRIPYNTTATSIVMDYSINKTSKTRTGKLTVAASPNGVTYKDEYTYTGTWQSDEAAFSAKLVDTESLGTRDVVAVQYNNASAYGAGQISYTVHLS